MLVRAALHACPTATQCDDIDVPRVDDDAWFRRPHLTTRRPTWRVDRCSDGVQFSAAREFPVRVSPRHRTDPRTRRHL